MAEAQQPAQGPHFPALSIHAPTCAGVRLAPSAHSASGTTAKASRSAPQWIHPRFLRAQQMSSLYTLERFSCEAVGRVLARVVFAVLPGPFSQDGANASMAWGRARYWRRWGFGPERGWGAWRDGSERHRSPAMCRCRGRSLSASQTPKCAMHPPRSGGELSRHAWCMCKRVEIEGNACWRHHVGFVSSRFRAWLV